MRDRLADAAGLIGAEPQRARLEFERLGVGFVLHPVREGGPRPFLRSEGHGRFEALALPQYADLPTSAAALPQSIGSRTFVVELPPGWMT